MWIVRNMKYKFHIWLVSLYYLRSFFFGCSRVQSVSIFVVSFGFFFVNIYEYHVVRRSNANKYDGEVS